MTASWRMTHRRSLRYRRMQMRHRCSGAVARALQGNRRNRSRSYPRIRQHETPSCSQTKRAKSIWRKSHLCRYWVASRAWRHCRTVLKWRRRTCLRRKMNKTLHAMLAISWGPKVTKDKVCSRKMDHLQPHYKINIEQTLRILPNVEIIKILQERSSYLPVSIWKSWRKTIRASKVMDSKLHRSAHMKSRSGRPLATVPSFKKEWTRQRQTSKLARRRAGWGCSARCWSMMRTFWQTTLNTHPRILSTIRNCRK